MLVKRVLPKARERLVTVSADAPVREAAALMAEPHTDLLVVCAADGRAIGVVSKTDIVGQIGHCEGCSCTNRVEMIMTRDIFSCRPDQWLQDIWSVMKERGIRRVPIVDQDHKPLGTIYAPDALEALLTEVEHEEALLRDYVMCVGYR